MGQWYEYYKECRRIYIHTYIHKCVYVIGLKKSEYYLRFPGAYKSSEKEKHGHKIIEYDCVSVYVCVCERGVTSIKNYKI